MATKIRLLIASALWLLVSVASAHPPYERAVGWFHRGDGIPISIVERYVDGIVVADPVSVQFRLPDGTPLASTEFAQDAALWRLSSGPLEIYQFEITTVPIASRVHRFDGYRLVDITSWRSRAFSPLVHTVHHWLGYVIALAIAAFVALVWFAFDRIPHRGWLRVVRYVGLALSRLTGALYVMMLLWFAPLSAPLLLIVALGLYAAFRRLFTRTKTA